MEQQKLLSIIIPTYNRSNILPYTLSLWKEQVEKHLDEVEFVVCNNASTDDTESVLAKVHDKHPFFSVVNYNDHVDVGVSIFRSMIDNAKGEFVLNWGDDDVPAPMLLDVILSKLHEHPEIGAIVFNRIEGNTYDDSVKLCDLSVVNGIFQDEYTYYSDSRKFAAEHYIEMGFLSVTICKTQEIIYNKKYYLKDNLGYEFLMPILCAMKGKPAIYLNFPLCIQRHAWGANGRNEWLVKYPLYAYIGHPRVLRALEKEGIVDNWQEIFNKLRFQKSDKEYYMNVLTYIRPNKDIYMPYLDEMLSYQADEKRINKTRRMMESAGIQNKFYLMKWKYDMGGIEYLLSIPIKIMKRIFKQH